MEHYKVNPIEEQPSAPHKETPSARPGYKKFERNGETYEEDSLLYEPRERYQDDLVRLEVVIAHKRQMLRELEENLKAHQSVASGVMHLLEDDIMQKAGYMKKEIEHLEITRTVTLQRLALLAVRDRYEKNKLDTLSTDVEN
jgi:hypothetical protein